MIKVGLLGAGFMGQMHAECYAQLKGVKLVAISDAQPDHLKKMAKKYHAEPFADSAKLISSADVDVIDICLPTFMHCKYTLLAAKKGRHVLCEKPIALTVAEANKMVSATKKAGVAFMVGHVIRFWPEYVLLKKYIDDRKLGRLLSISMLRVGTLPVWAWKNWFNNPAKSGSAAVDLHIHDTDFLLYALGKPKTINSVGSKHKNAWHHIFTNFTFKNKVPATVEAAWAIAPKYPFRMHFAAFFEKGVLEFDSSKSEGLTLFTNSGKVKHPKVPQPATKSADIGGNISELGGYYSEIAYFIKCVKQGKKPLISTPEDARDSLAIVLKELASAEKNL